MDFPKGQTFSHGQINRDETVECDVVIVGSGAGGAAAAWVLSALGHRVVILEEGRKFEPEELKPKASWAFRNLYAERSTRFMQGNLFIPLPGGRAVGGSTLLNSAICFRTPDKILNRWRTEFGVAWADGASMAPVFTEIEQAIGVEKTHPSIARSNSLTFKRGCDALGIHGDFISRNAPGCVGCGLCQLGCPIGGKGSVDRNLIPSSLATGAALITSARVVEVIVEKGAAVGVRAQLLEPMSEKPELKLEVRAKKVFLCGGAINTPVLLLRQGIANSSGMVGKNLRVHAAAGVCARFDEVIDPWDGATQGFYVDTEDSILETFSATPDIYFTQYSYFAKPLDLLRHLASCGCMLGDESSGEVKPGMMGRASIRYTLEEGDKKRLLKGMRLISKIFFAAGARELHPAVHGFGTASSQAELENICRDDTPVENLSVYASHPMGTCRMGADKKTTVVAPTGESHDVRNLFLADASVFPTSLGVNPQVSVMSTSVVIARQAAKLG
ncbi:MAG: GMC family oxidoreductase N-terminal domain-containing protein [Myxococcaceae bacterium]